MDGRCVVSMVDKKTMDFYRAVPADLEGIVNQLRNTRGVECAIFMYQTNVLEYKVSLRTSEKVNAAEVASYFGGGGHVRAAPAYRTLWWRFPGRQAAPLLSIYGSWKYWSAVCRWFASG